jgi:hypothetical protein
MSRDTSNMRAVFVKPDAKKPAMNHSCSKETTDSWTVYGMGAGPDPVELIDARCWMGRSRQASTVYASIWIHGGDYRSGRGDAGGYGYHKSSAAMAAAISAAGIELYGSPYTNLETRWNYDENRAYTPAEKAAITRRLAKKRCYFGGAGDDSTRGALLAIGRALTYTDAAGKVRKYRGVFIGR